jgi:hypothetical protein
MARRRSFTPRLYLAATTSNNISAIGSGNPRRVARRAKERHPRSCARPRRVLALALE